MHQFNEGHPAFNGFSKFYFQVIGPRLQQEEETRKKDVRDTLSVASGTALATALLVFLFLRFELDWRLIGTVAFVGTALIFSLSSRLLNVRESTKYSLIGGFCRFKQWSFWKDTPLLGTSWEFKELKLLPSYKIVSYEGHISGEAHGSKFEFVRVAMRNSKSKKDAPSPFQFKYTGQMISIEFEKNFPGRTVVFSDKGIFNKKRVGDMKRVRLVDPVFEKMFEAYGSDQVESRYFLSPDFMHRLVELEHAFEGKSIRFGLVENRLLITIETRMRLGAGSMFRPLDEPERMQNVLDILAAIYNVIDGITKPLERIVENPYSSQE